MSRTSLSSVVSRQIPEFIREDFPTFVAFVEAYYEFLQTQGVDLSSVKDLDKTLDSFVGEFKKELAHNYPNIAGDERFLLAHIKDQYLAKGSESSYNLLFRLLFGKRTELIYPGTQMLRASDGKWNQEISVFAHVDYGDPLEIVGKLVNIETENTVIRIVIDKKEDLVGEVDRIVALGGDIYEFFLDKKFIGVIEPGNRIRFKDTFQATILPATQTPTITQPGKNFRVGQVFDIISGTGTGALLKVTAVDTNNGIKHAEFIKFGLGYSTSFSLPFLASNPTNSVALVRVSSVSRSGQSLTIGDATAGYDEQGYINTEDYVVSNVIISATGTIGSITGSGPWTATITGMSSTTGLSYGLPITATAGTGTLFGGTPTSCVVASIVSGTSITYTVTGGTTPTAGTITNLTASAYVNGGYAGTLIKEFTQTFANSAANSDDPAVVEVSLGAIMKYPGYYRSNDGFLDDSIFIQDSKYYQAFSYVVKIDERLASYKSAVKTMLHPAGMALFGEFSITNNIDLSVELQSLINSLGTTLVDILGILTDTTIAKVVTKSVPADELTTPTDNTDIIKVVTKPVPGDALATPTDNTDIIKVVTKPVPGDALATPTDANTIAKAVTKPVPGDALTTPTDNNITFLTQFVKTLTPETLTTPTDNNFTIGKLVVRTLTPETLTTPTDNNITFAVTRVRTLTPETLTTPTDNNITLKLLNRILEDQLGTPTTLGYVILNSYYGEDYIQFADEYSVGSRETTFNT